MTVRTPIGIILPTFPDRVIKTRSGKEKHVEYKVITGSLKATNDAQGIVEGYLNTIGNIDYGLDRTMPGAFKRTLDLSYKRKNANNDQFLWPYLWNHSTDVLPPGGIFDADEDKIGLYIKAQLNLDYQLGRDMYSSLKFGNLKKQSMGYLAHQTEYVREEGQLIRDLIEVEILEGSGVIFPMNDQADVTSVKNRFWTGAALNSKGASGKTTWPLGDRNAAWDNGAAHNRIVAHFTDSDGKLDTSGMKSVHFWFDDSAPENVTSYKLLFCDVVSGDIKAMPRAIFACAGSHGVDAADIPEGDVASIKAKIETYYKKMAKEFNDDSIKAPWLDTGKRGRFRMNKKDFNDRYREECIEDWLWSDFSNLMTALRQSIIDIFLIGDTPQTDIEDTVLNDGPDGVGFITALKTFVQKGIDLDVANYLSEILSENPGMDPDSVMYYMSRKNPLLATKAGAAFSQTNTDAIYQHMANLHAMADKQAKALHDAADGLQEALNGLGAPSNPSWRQQGTTADDEKHSRRARGRKAGAEFSQDNLQMLGEHVSDLHDVADTIHQMAEDLAQNTGASTYTDPDGNPDNAKETDKNKAASRTDARSRKHSLTSTAVNGGDLSIGAALAELGKLTVKL